MFILAIRTAVLQTTTLGKRVWNAKGHQQNPVGLLLVCLKTVRMNGVRLILKLVE